MTTQLSPEVAIHSLSITEMAGAIAEGRLTPLGIAEALLARIKAYDGKIQSFSHLDEAGVLAEAAKLTAEAKAGKLRGPLHGVPFGAKEQFAVGGLATRGDWKDPNPPIAGSDATVVAKLRDAGALLMGKLYMTGPSGTPPTRNPWNLNHTPGGSSSGSGAAVGSRFVPFALSEQTAGSGIRPAAYCGVSALKPTYGRNSRYGMFQMAWSHDHACIIAPSSRDVARVFEVTAGYDTMDPSSKPGGVTPYQALTRPPRIGVVRNFFPELTEGYMQDAVERAAGKLAKAGADVVDFDLPDSFGLAWPNWALVMGAESTVINMHAASRREAAGRPPAVMPVGKTKPKSRWASTFRDSAPLIPATYYLQAQRLRRWIRDQVDASLEGYDAILMATAPGEAPDDLTGSGDWSLLVCWSHVGLPTINIPGGLSDNGLPLGLQMAGASMSDEHLLAVGAWCEDILGLLPAPELPQ